MAGRFEDDRGVIEDILGPVDSVTKITTVKGAVRGNHVHDRTTQWTLVLSGSLLVMHNLTNGPAERILGPGEMVIEYSGVPHAWKALEDTECLVFTRGPRSGQAYESDVRRLKEPLLT